MSDHMESNDGTRESLWQQRAAEFAAWAEQVDLTDLRPLDTRALQRLSKLADVRQEIDDAIRVTVQEARRQRSTWSEIGAMLGVTKQAAQQKYAPMLVGIQQDTSDADAAVTERPRRQHASAYGSTIGVQAPPGLVAHADWSKDPRKRWFAAAVLGDDGRYGVGAPVPVGDVGTYFSRLRACAGPSAAVLTGFDFPIGLPERYAARAGLSDFRTTLPRLGRDEWREFYEPAPSRSAISLARPFYPHRSGSKGEHSKRHLVERLGVQGSDDLKRRCEREAESLFWLIGGKQVGKAAISGWKELLGPASASDAPLTIWPFDGCLDDLLEQPGIVVAETYPAVVCRHLGLAVSKSNRSKRRQSDRAADAPTLRAWAHANGVRLTKGLEDKIEEGFGPSPDGEDPFDALVGLFGMLDVVLGHLASGEPQDDKTQVEGWILGYSEA